MSDRAPKCPFCGATLPAATIDRDATPARGVDVGTALPIPPSPPRPSPGPEAGVVGEPSEPVLLGPFDRVRPLDASGRTWLGFAPASGRAAVVKALGGNPDRQAAGLWTALAPHPSVVRAAGIVTGDGSGDEGPRVVYEYVAPDAHSRKVQGRSAFERRLRREPISFPDVLRLGVLVCRGLEHVYAGGVHGHGNLKPSNLLLGLDGGLRVSEPGLLGVEAPVHLAPERFDGGEADERSDVYSLGVLLFQMAANGRPPFDAPAGGSAEGGSARYRESLRHLHKDALVPRLDSPLAALLERCLQKAPAARFSTVAALRTELQDLLRRETGLLPALPSPAEAAGWARAQQALALLAVGRADPAVRAFDEALLVLPPTASVRAARATALNVLGRHEEAVRAAEEAIAVDPQHAPAWRQKGESLAALGQHEEALDALEQTAVIAPRDAAALVALGRLQGAVGRLPQALSAYDRAVAADAEYVDVWLERGRTLATAGLRADAAGALLRFLEVSPTGHPARPRAEELLREVRGLEPAPAHRAVRNAPGPTQTAAPPPVAPPPEAAEPSPAGYIGESGVMLGPTGAAALRNMAREDEALSGGSSAPAAASTQPEPAPTFIAPEEAEPEPLPASPPRPPETEPEPTDVTGLNERGVALFREGRLGEALLSFDRALAVDSRNPATWSNRANVLVRLGRAEESLTGHERALAREPRLPGSWLSKATIENALGRPAQARRSLLELLSLQPPPEPRLLDQARLLLADIEGQGIPPGQRTALGFLLAGVQHAEAGRLEESVADFDEAVGQDTLLAAGWLFKGDALASLGRLGEAARAYDEGLAADPGEVRLLLGLGRTRARLGDLDVAAAVLGRALEMTAGESRGPIERLLSAVEARRAPPAPVAPPVAPEPVERPHEPVEGPHEPHPLPAALLEEPTAEEPLAENAADWANKGQAALKAGRADEALSSFSRAVELDARDVAAWMGQAESLVRSGRFLDAVQSYDEALQLSPRLREAWIGRGASLNRLGRVDEAISSFVKVLQTDPADAEALYQKAGSEEEAGRGAEAVRSYEQFLASAPEDPRREHVAAQVKALALSLHAPPAPPAPAPASPTQPPADPVASAAALMAQGHHAEALEGLDHAFAGGADDATFWMARGDALRALGRKEEAAAAFDQAIKRAPRDPAAWIKKGEALDAAGIFGEAVACYDQAVQLHPRHTGAWNSKGVALTRLGRIEEALHCFTRALELDPRLALARFNKGAAEDQLGRGEEASRSYQAFLSLAPPSQRPQIQYAQKRLQALKGPPPGPSAT